MFCTGKEQLTCNSEKMGCEGCYYNDEIKVGDLLKVSPRQTVPITEEIKNFIDMHRSFTDKNLVEFLGRIKKDGDSVWKITQN